MSEKSHLWSFKTSLKPIWQWRGLLCHQPEEKKKKKDRDRDFEIEPEVEEFRPNVKVEIEHSGDRPVRACRTQQGKVICKYSCCFFLCFLLWFFLSNVECFSNVENESTPRQQLLEHFLRQLQRSGLIDFFFLNTLNWYQWFLIPKLHYRVICYNWVKVFMVEAIYNSNWETTFFQERSTWILCVSCNGCHCSRLFNDHQASYGLQHNERQDYKQWVQHSYRV